MRYSSKPVRKCYTCLLNLDDHCWLYRYPRGQWRDEKKCGAFENEEIYGEFRTWQKQPDIKTRKALRRELFRTKRRPLPRRQQSKEGRYSKH